MRYLLIVFCLTICNASYSQIGLEINEIAPGGINGFQVKYRTALILVTLVKGKDIKIKVGSGFILKNKYVATCYHVFKGLEDSLYTPTEIRVLYNINVLNRSKVLKFTYDSVFATLDYQTLPEQYDFKKHIYKGDTESDFIILKLNHDVKAFSSAIDTSTAKTGDVLLATGLSFDERKIGDSTYTDSDFSSSDNTVFKVDTLGNRNFKIYTYGFARHGYSGSPLFTKNGEIVGVVQEGILSKDAPLKINFLLSKSLITKNQSALILKFLKEDKEGGIGISTDISYLLKKYMEGYY